MCVCVCVCCIALFRGVSAYECYVCDSSDISCQENFFVSLGKTTTSGCACCSVRCALLYRTLHRPTKRICHQKVVYFPTLYFALGNFRNLKITKLAVKEYLFEIKQVNSTLFVRNSFFCSKHRKSLQNVHPYAH